MSSYPIDRVAREKFGFEALRPGQREAIVSVLDGKDTLVVMSTGSGKSAIHAIAGWIKAGVTVVVAPPGARSNDPRSEDALSLTADELGNDDVLARLRAAGPWLIAIEDAHCVCGGRADFIPNYLRLGAFIAEMGHPPVLALTPDAPAPVRDEIVEKLHLHDPFVVAPAQHGV
jgi:ATP-dependent DNA helicase RecQ